MLRSFFVFLIFALTTALPLAAQHPLIRNYQSSAYEAGTQNWCVAKGFGGRMMFGNNYGLLDFDSRSWTLTHVPNHTAVRAIYYDEAKHRVYVGASGEFGYFVGKDYTSLSDKLAKAPGKHPEAASGEIWHIFALADNVVMQSKEYIYIIDAHDRVQTVKMPGRIDASAPAGGRIIAATAEGVWTLTPGQRPQKLECASALAGATVRQIVPMPAPKNPTSKAAKGSKGEAGSYIFATASQGLYVWHTGSAKFEALQLDITSYLTENQIFCATVKGSQLAIGTVSGGLVVKDFATGHTAYANTATGLAVNTVLAVDYDDNDHIWMGLNNGIAFMASRVAGIGLTSAIGGIGTGYSSLREDGLLFLGTNQGLYTLPYPLHPSPRPEVPHIMEGMTGQVWMLARAFGDLFACTDGGLYQLPHGGNGRPQRIDGVDGTWNVIELTAPSAGNPLLLACDYKGLVVLQRDGGHYSVRNRIAGTDIVSGDFALDSDGTLWVSHWQKGIYHFWMDAEHRRIVKTEHFGKDNGLPTDEGNAIVTIGGRIHISAVGGLHAYDSRSHKLVAPKGHPQFQTYDPAPAIIETPAGDVFAINKNYLALAHRLPKGGYRVDESSFRKMGYDLQYGIGSAGFVDSTHTILNTSTGFVLVDHCYEAAPHSNPLFVSSITSTNNGEVLLYDVMATPPTKDDAAPLRISHRDNSLRIVFVMPEYESPKKVVYQCMLEGYDKDWSEERTTGIKEYTKLPKGHYTFCVRARNLQTGETQNTTMDIEILPAWYETWWAIALYMLIFLAISYAAMRFYTRRAQAAVARQMEEQRRVQREERHRLEAENARKESEVVQLRNEQLELELKHRSSKLADSTTNLIRKNDILLDIDERLQELSSSVPPSDENRAIFHRSIAELRRKIKDNIANDDNWDKFEQNFNLVYDNFMVKLSERFPALKTSDKRICAYLRMGLSSKEMASLMNTAVRSIETARYRLRKKLNLENGENLVDFLQHFDEQEDRGHEI